MVLCAGEGGGVSAIDRCSPRSGGDHRRTVSQFAANSELRQGSGGGTSGSHGCASEASSRTFSASLHEDKPLRLSRSVTDNLLRGRFERELSRPLDSQTTRGEDMTTSDLPEVSESPQEAAHSSLDQVCSECGAPIRQNLASSTAERHDPEVRQPENNVSPAQRRRMTQGHRITGEIQYSSYQEREDIYRAAYQACGWDPVI